MYLMFVMVCHLLPFRWRYLYRVVHRRHKGLITALSYSSDTNRLRIDSRENSSDTGRLREPVLQVDEDKWSHVQHGYTSVYQELTILRAQS